MNLISREEMLLNFQNAGGKPCLLKFIASENGQLRTIERCLYGGQKREKTSPAVNKSGVPRRVSSLKETGRIPLIDMDAPEGNQFRTPFISHIIQYNNFQVKH